MFLQRYYLECLSLASYLIADEESGEAVVIDPQRDIDIYLEEARARGLTIKHVVLTHFHADFIAGHIELRDAVGARIHLGARAQAEFDFNPLRDGDVLRVGRLALKVLETPGHTPEGISLVLLDPDGDGERPHAVFTGDTLFLGDVGRPDLLASIGVTASELAEMLYDSLHDKLLKLPDETLVYPAHGAGSMCGKSLSSEAVSTMGEQRKYNYALQPMDKASFIQLVTADQPEAPEYFLHDAVLNRQDRETLESVLARARRPLPLPDVLRLRGEGAQLLDTRDPVEFAGAHVRGAINVGIDGRFASWAGTVLDKQRPIVVIADPERVEESLTRLGRIGFDQVVGYLDGGMQALAGYDAELAQVERITAPALHEAGRATVVDVRTPAEWEAGHLEGSLNIPLIQLKHRLDELPAESEGGMLVVHCQGGYRSSIAASLIQSQLHRTVVDLVGGYKAWQASQLPVAAAQPS